jgi:hypothetical protein
MQTRKERKQIELVDEFEWFLDEEFILLKNSHHSEKPPYALVNQNYNYDKSILLNSVLPKVVEYTTVLMSSGKYEYACYKCIKDNHRTPSLSNKLKT